MPCFLGLIIDPPRGFPVSSAPLRTLNFLSFVPILLSCEKALLWTPLTLADLATLLSGCLQWLIFTWLWVLCPSWYLPCCLSVILENSCPLSLQIFLLPHSLFSWALSYVYLTLSSSSLMFLLSSVQVADELNSSSLVPWFWGFLFFCFL